MQDENLSLYRNGVLLERARREGRSLSREERVIIYSARKRAAEAGSEQADINYCEMVAGLDRHAILEPIKVDVRFAYYTEPYQEIPPVASYFIVVSNHPALPRHGNVGADQLKNASIKIPKTPTYEQWVKVGRPAFRGKEI